MDTDQQWMQIICKLRRIKQFKYRQTNKNRRTALHLGIMPDDFKDEFVIKILHELTVFDRETGPEEDNDPNEPGSIWIFKKRYQGELFYIKVKEMLDGHIIVRSCHLDNI